MQLDLFQLDAFSDRVFAGNPAAVCPLPHWLDDATLQAIAAENNLSETAFFVREARGYHLRWFTPTLEVQLCGHATLASGALILQRLEPDASDVRFHTKSGELHVRREGDVYAVDLPASPARPITPPPALAAALGTTPLEVLAGHSYVAVLASERDVRALEPDLRALSRLELSAAMVTAPGEQHDFVSRFFAPAAGVDEDPVTGSAHCTLMPYWAARLGRSRLRAYQASRRGGELDCELAGERVVVRGACVLYLEGRIRVPG